MELGFNGAGAYEFDGVNDYISISQTTFDFRCWFYFTNFWLKKRY